MHCNKSRTESAVKYEQVDRYKEVMCTSTPPLRILIIRRGAGTGESWFTISGIPAKPLQCSADRLSSGC